MTGTAAPGNADDEAAPFWEGAAQGRLMLKRCVDTGRVFFYPREHSPFTAGATEWVAATGEGEIYSCSVSHRADPPYCIAYVRLDEGPIMLSNILDGDLSRIAIGRRVRTVFRPGAEGRPTPFFELID